VTPLDSELSIPQGPGLIWGEDSRSQWGQRFGVRGLGSACETLAHIHRPVGERGVWGATNIKVRSCET
jgi:hypothetical protein